MFEICYIIVVLCFAATATANVAVSSLLICLCWYIIAMYKELERQLFVLNKKGELNRTQMLKDCVKYHTEILEL